MPDAVTCGRPPLGPLTPGARTALEHLARGWAAKRSAVSLGISAKAIEHRRQQAYAAIGVEGVAEPMFAAAAAYARATDERPAEEGERARARQARRLRFVERVVMERTADGAGAGEIAAAVGVEARQVREIRSRVYDRAGIRAGEVDHPGSVAVARFVRGDLFGNVSWGNQV